MKKFINKLKKGFTLVELAIVIAVIAILVAVLVPTFVALIDKAGESKDSQLVKNLNTSITIENASGDIVTMKDAIDAAKENGYDVAQITPTSDGYDILWDQETKYFLLADSEGNVVYSSGSYGNLLTDNYETYRFWKIADSSESLSDVYSNYLAYEATSITTSTGVDVGSYSNVAITIDEEGKTTSQATKIKVGTATAEKTAGETSDEKPLIMVNCDAGSLKINTAATVIINGNITSNVEIAYAGTTVVIAEKANVPNVLVTAEKVTITNNSSVAVTVGTSGEGTVAAVNGSQNEIVTNLDTTLLSYFAGGYGTEASPFLISTSQQFSNIYSISSDPSTYGYDETNYVYYKLTNDISLTTGVIVSSTDTDNVTTYYPSFAGKLLYSVFDGDGYTIDASSCLTDYEDYNHNIFYEVEDSEFNNVTINMAGKTVSIVNWMRGTCSFTGVDVTGTVSFSDRNLGVYSTYTRGNITFTDCTNYAKITGIGGASSYCAVFVGYCNGNYDTWTMSLTFNNCINAGTLTAGKAAMFIGNLCTTTNYVTLSINNCKNTGTIRATYTDYTPDYYIASGGIASSDKFIVNGVNYEPGKGPSLNNVYQGPDDTVTIYLNSNGYFEITESNISGASYYVVSIALYDLVYDEYNGGTNIWYVNVKISAEDIENGTYTTALKNLKFMDLPTYKTYDSELSNITTVTDGTNTYYTVEVSGETYYLINTAREYLSNGIASATIFTVSVYASDGSLLSSASM